MSHIIAIGGCGFSDTPYDNLLHRYLIEQTGKPNPKVCFLPQASAESDVYVVQFYDAYFRLGTQPSWFSTFGMVADGWEAKLRDQDMIYVGGGNTRSMLALWREWGVDQVLKQAYDNGTVLAGLSAGSICWFEQGITDSVYPLGVLPCLGFLTGSCCPHYNSEPERQPSYTKFVQSADAMAGIALDDYVGAHYVDGELHQVISSHPQGRAHRVTQGEATATETPLDVVYLG